MKRLNVISTTTDLVEDTVVARIEVLEDGSGYSIVDAVLETKFEGASMSESEITEKAKRFYTETIGPLE